MNALLIWPIASPLLLAPLLYFVPRLIRRSAYPLALLFSLLQFVPLLLLWGALEEQQVLIHAVGGWVAERGILLALDHLALFMLAVIQVLFFLALIFFQALRYDEREHFLTLYFICQAGLNGMVLTSDLFNLYVFLEIASIVSYALVAYSKTRGGIEGGFKYLVLGSMGSICILWATALVYGVAGNLNLAYLSQVMDEAPVLLRRAIFVLYLVGWGLKSAIFPFHIWQADAYGEAPAPVGAVLSGVGSKVPIYCLLRVLSLLFGLSLLPALDFHRVVAGLGTLAILVGHLMAYRQDNLRRLLSFSSVAHIGYITVGLAVAAPGSLEGAFYHIVNHGVLKAGLFFFAGVAIFHLGSERIHELQGLYRRSPALAVSFIILALGMIGIPPVNGFLSKWIIVMSAMEAGFYVPAAAIALGGLIALFYYIRIIGEMFKCGGEHQVSTQIELVPGQAGPLVAMVGLSLVLFFASGPVLEVIGRGVQMLFEHEPYVRAVLGL